MTTLVQLTNRRWEKFYLNADLIEQIFEREGSTSEIKLTSGSFATCIESPDKVARIVEEATREPSP